MDKKASNLISSGIAIFDCKNRILLQKRGDCNMWCIPGGIVEVGEDTKSCAKREVLEETNLVVDNLQLYNVYSGSGMFWTYPDGNKYFMISILYISRNYHGVLKPDLKESIDLKFFKLDSLPIVVSTNHQMIKDLLKSELA